MSHIKGGEDTRKRKKKWGKLKTNKLDPDSFQCSCLSLTNNIRHGEPMQITPHYIR